MTNSSTNPPVVPSEVGWQFVPQYYTFVNKQPNRLHCFYTKSSTFIHGTEGEDGKPCYGQQEIHNKITSIGFQDCKVFIHSVDAQSSANGGIIIQVIGEMSNHGEAWRKFVQTFFLAEQPNGYFVLNDIFRFLKEETVESDDASDDGNEAVPTDAVPEPAPVPASPIPAAEPPREPTPPPVQAATAPPVEEAPTTDVPEPPVIDETPAPAPEPTEVQPPTITPAAATPNGIHTPEPEKSTPASIVEKSPAPSPAPQPQQPVAPSPAPPTAAAAAPTPPPAAHSPAPAPSPAPASTAPAAPRSWASLAATNSRKWGSAVAQESRGVTETPVSPSPAASGTQTPPTATAPPSRGSHHQHQHQHQQSGSTGNHPAYLAAQNVAITQCFVKGVVESVSQTALTNILTQRFGPVKDVEIVRNKACAFLEFITLDAAKRAIVTSLPQNQGGEGGIWIDVGGDGGSVRISVETKKERGERPVSRPRGGAPPVNGEGRGGAGGGGGYRGRGGPGGRGRGAPGGGK